MLLKDKYFSVLHEERISANEAVYLCELKEDCDVYRGHFPGDPVSPGVCNIEMIKECTMLLTGKNLMIGTVKQCRLTAIASPSVCPKVDVKVSVAASEDGESYAVMASVTDAEQSYMEFKGTMKNRE